VGPALDVETATVRTPDGRTLALETGGDPGGVPVLVHGGTPNSRHLYPGWVGPARELGVRLISYDRPGYGGSTPQAGRTVASCAADVRAIASELGIRRLGVWGYSGGGPHALACAALLPGLVPAAAALCSVAPYGAEGLDYFGGMGQDNVDDIKLELEDPQAAREKLARQREEMLQLAPGDVEAGLKTLLSPVDRDALTHEVAEWLVHTGADGLAETDEGWWEDGEAHLHDWGFALSDIAIPVQIWHGRHDRFVPFQQGEWLAAHVPGAEPHLSDADGHLTLVINRAPDVLRWLRDRTA